MLTSRPRVLAVDDDQELLSLVARLAPEEGFAVTAARSIAEGLGSLRAQACDLVLIDTQMPGAGGLDVLERVRHASPGTHVAVTTGAGSIDGAVMAVKRGAIEYLT